MDIIIFFKKGFKYLYRETVLYGVWHFSSFFPLFPTYMYSRARARHWRFLGAKVGKNVFIGYGCYLDVSSMKRLEIDDYVGIGAECSFLLHKIDMEAFVDRKEGIPIKEGRIHICSNVQIGMRSFIMPGVTIGEGAFVAAHSTITKDVPPYTIVGGCPAKILGTVKQWKSQDEVSIK